MAGAPKITRAKRAQFRRRAQEILLRGQAAGWVSARVVAAMRAELPDLQPLEAWRLANGWSRPDVIAGIAALYRRAQLAAPPLNSSMLCRWEHGDGLPSPEYADALCRLYQASPDELGLPARSGLTRYPIVPDPRRSADAHQPAVAVRTSVLLAFAAEGPAGGPVTLEQLDHTVRYYDRHYAEFPPVMLINEVHHCRAVAAAMLDAPRPAEDRRELLGVAARLSALLGNLAFHVADRPAAEIHIDIAAELATTIGDDRLLSWSLGARSMLALDAGDPNRALDLARHAVGHAREPLRRAQAIAWAELPALVRLGRVNEARDAMLAARKEMDASPVPEVPGRLGFDRAELELHLAEAAAGLGDLVATRAHAARSSRHTQPGRPGWAAITLVIALANAAGGNAEAAAELGLHVLEAMPPEMLRSTTLRRLTELDGRLAMSGMGGPAAADIHEHLRTIRIGTRTVDPVT